MRRLVPDYAGPVTGGRGDLPDINHPRMLLLQWRAHAERLGELLADCGRFTDYDNPADQPTAVLRARMLAIEECAAQLEERLRWSGMLDP